MIRLCGLEIEDTVASGEPDEDWNGRVIKFLCKKL
jgi:hypothetical protein